MANVMMGCGHSSSAESDGKPICAICFGLDPGAEVVMSKEMTPDLTGRLARCPSCEKIVDSSLELAFFRYRKSDKYDGFYCGCRGWS